MAKIDNLNSGQLAPLIRRIENLERSLSLASSSVERGRMRFYEGSELLIQDSNLNVVGTATIRGTLRADGTIAFTGTLTQSGPSAFTGQTNVSGDFTVTGPTKLNGKTDIGGNTSVTGDLTVTGPTKLNGKTDIGGNTTVTGDLGVKGPLDVTGPMATKGTLSVEGKTTLKDDMNVTSGGRIKAGNVEILPSNGGQINFLNGGITSDAFGMGFVNTLGIQFVSRDINMASIPSKSGAEANIHIDGAGRLWRVP